VHLEKIVSEECNEEECGTLEQLAGGDNIRLRNIVLDFTRVTSVDATAAKDIIDLINVYKAQSIEVLVVGIRAEVECTMKLAGISDLILKTNFFVLMHDALNAVHLSKGSISGPR